MRVAREKASWYFRRRERATALQDLFAGGLAARKAGRGELGSANAPADGDRVGAGGGTCGGGAHQSHCGSFCPNRDRRRHMDLAGDISLEAEKARSTANPAVPQRNRIPMPNQRLWKS